MIEDRLIALSSAQSGLRRRGIVQCRLCVVASREACPVCKAMDDGQPWRWMSLWMSMWRLAALLSVDQWSQGAFRTSVSCHRMQRNQGRPVSRGWDVVDAGAVGTAGQRKQRQGSANATPGNMHLFGGSLRCME